MEIKDKFDTPLKDKFQVFCGDCGDYWWPVPNSPLWHQAKKRFESGKLDTLCVSGKRCGCIKELVEPDAPFRVFGYDGFELTDFDVPCHTFVEAVRKFLELSRTNIYCVFIKGVSRAVEYKLGVYC